MAIGQSGDSAPNIKSFHSLDLYFFSGLGTIEKILNNSDRPGVEPSSFLHPLEKPQLTRPCRHQSIWPHVIDHYLADQTDYLTKSPQGQTLQQCADGIACVFPTFVMW